MFRTTGIILAAAVAMLITRSAAAQPACYYGEDCHEQNAAAGTVMGTIAGGIIGNQFGLGAAAWHQGSAA